MSKENKEFYCDYYNTGHMKRCSEQCDNCKNKENEQKDMTPEKIVSDWQNTYAPNEGQFIKSDIENEGYWYKSKCGTHGANLKVYCEELIEYYEEEIFPIKIKHLQDQINELEQWKKEQIDTFLPLMEFMHSNTELNAGESIAKKAIEFIKERNLLKQSADELAEVLIHMKTSVDHANIEWIKKGLTALDNYKHLTTKTE